MYIDPAPALAELRTLHPDAEYTGRMTGGDCDGWLTFSVPHPAGAVHTYICAPACWIAAIQANPTATLSRLPDARVTGAGVTPAAALSALRTEIAALAAAIAGVTV
jgi:hypothetical protein